MEKIPRTQLTEGMLADLYRNLATEHPDETEVYFKKQNGMFQLADNPNSVRKEFENILTVVITVSKWFGKFGKFGGEMCSKMINILLNLGNILFVV